MGAALSFLLGDLLLGIGRSLVVWTIAAFLGIGLMFVGTSILGSSMSLAGYLFPAVRNVENDLPDYDE